MGAQRKQTEANGKTPHVVQDGRGSDLDGMAATLVVPPLPPAPFPAWDECRYQFKRLLAPGACGGGQVELYIDIQTDAHVAVKRFPRQQMCSSPEAFHAANPGSLQNPWEELAVTQRLGGLGPACVPFGVCACHGTYCSAQGDALLVTEYMPNGDLFEFAGHLGEPGPEREAQVWPIVSSLLSAIRVLHNAGVAHGDVSLENALRRPGPCGEVVLIDFGAVFTGDLAAASGTRGKPSYQAPEMHTCQVYDARAADLFACGVAAYCLALGCYPWASTRPGQSNAFACLRDCGLEAFLGKKRIRHCGAGADDCGKPAVECMSADFRRLLSTLLDLLPHRRFNLEGFDHQDVRRIHDVLGS